MAHCARSKIFDEFTDLCSSCQCSEMPCALPCKHFFCLEFLEKYKIDQGVDNDQIIPCPSQTCKELFRIPPNGFRGMIACYRCLQQIGFSSHSPHQSKTLLFEPEIIVGRFFCKQCHLFFCKQHYDELHNSPIMKSVSLRIYSEERHNIIMARIVRIDRATKLSRNEILCKRHASFSANIMAVKYIVTEHYEKMCTQLERDYNTLKDLLDNSVRQFTEDIFAEINRNTSLGRPEDTAHVHLNPTMKGRRPLEEVPNFIFTASDFGLTNLIGILNTTTRHVNSESHIIWNTIQFIALLLISLICFDVV